MSVTESDTGELLAITFDVISIGTIDGNFDNITVDGEISGYTWNTENIEETGELIAINNMYVSLAEGGTEVFVYPSPATVGESFEVGLVIDETKDISIEIYDVLGRKQVYLERTLTAYDYTKITIDSTDFGLGEMSSGVYLLIVVSEGNVITDTWFAIEPGF